MFQGHHVHTIDSKNRMSLPLEFRQELQRLSDRPPVLTHGCECLDLYPSEDWQAFTGRILGIADVDPEAQDYARMLVAGAVQCPIDKQGRILVPPRLREYAALDREVTVAGVGPKIELWNTGRYDASFIQSRARFREMAVSVAVKLRD